MTVGSGLADPLGVSVGDGVEVGAGGDTIEPPDPEMGGRGVRLGLAVPLANAASVGVALPRAKVEPAGFVPGTYPVSDVPTRSAPMTRIRLRNPRAATRRARWAIDTSMRFLWRGRSVAGRGLRRSYHRRPRNPARRRAEPRGRVDGARPWG
jgi:hypothetical protein